MHRPHRSRVDIARTPLGSAIPGSQGMGSGLQVRPVIGSRGAVPEDFIPLQSNPVCGFLKSGHDMRSFSRGCSVCWAPSRLSLTSDGEALWKSSWHAKFQVSEANGLTIMNPLANRTCIIRQSRPGPYKRTAICLNHLTRRHLTKTSFYVATSSRTVTSAIFNV